MKNLMIAVIAVIGLALMLVPVAAEMVVEDVPRESHLSNGRTDQAGYEGRAPVVGDGTTTNFAGAGHDHNELQGGD